MIAFAPGRVNLIGEHTDYNQGLALPFAIGAGVTVSAEPIAELRIEATAVDLGERDEFSLDRPGRAPGWRAFVRGAAAELQRAGVGLRGARVEIRGDVPRGAGLSSSAALEVALCLALIAVAGEAPPERLVLARLCSRVENEWVGARTGLLDQLASLYGQAKHAVLIDFRSLAIRILELELGGCRFVTVDSGESHANAASGYNQRRAECELACAELGVESLREATLDAARRLPEPLSRRARHVITENGRVEAAVRALERGDYDELGRLLNESHASLRDDYEVSTPLVDAAVARLRRGGALGARVIGGGFGGHVLGLMAPGAVLQADAISVAPGPGAHLISG